MRDTFSVNMKKVYELRLKKFWTTAKLGREAHLSQATIFALNVKR